MKDHLFIYFQNNNIMVNKREKIYFIISISDKGLSSFFISFIPFLLHFSSFLHTFFVLILSYLSGTCISLFCRHIWTVLFFLFWMFLTGTFLQVRGCTCIQCTPSPPPPAYAPVRSFETKLFRKTYLLHTLHNEMTR